MNYIADTHAFLWHLTESPTLSQKAKDIFRLADEGKATIILPAIVLLECIDIIDKKKVKIQFEEILVQMTQASNFVLAEMNWVLLLETNKVKGFKDLHDRIIVATARVFGAPIISKDKVIAGAHPNTIW